MRQKYSQAMLISLILLLLLVIFFLLPPLFRSSQTYLLLGALLLAALAIALTAVCLVSGIRQGKRIRQMEQLQEWLIDRDLKTYFKDEDYRQKVPQEVQKVLSNLVQIIGNQYSASILEKQMEYSALQSQINPHFLYNTLEAIRSEALLCGQPRIATMTEKLSRFFRYCISNRGDYVTLREELDNINDYFFIQRFRFENRFALEIHTHDEEILDFILPKLTLQPLVENAIFHGLEQKRGPGKLNIYLVETEDRLYITVSDDGIGMEEKTVEALNVKLSNPLGSADLTQPESSRGAGIALTNVNGRLKLFFGDRADMHISSTLGKGTDIQIVLPMHRADPRQDGAEKG